MVSEPSTAARGNVLIRTVGRPESGTAGSDEPAALVRVAVYARISTDEQHQPYSLEAQRERLSAYLQSQPGWMAVGPIYADERSGAITDRPGLQQALIAARAGEFDVLLVYRVDRLARSLGALVSVLDELAAAGVGLRSATEPIDTSSVVGRMLIHMLGVFAQFEREIIIDRVICGMERKAVAGRWTGGTRPYGYRVDQQTDSLVPEPDEAPIVRQIFTEYAHRSRGVRAIASQLDACGLRNRSGKVWSGHTISRLLSNRVYLGEKIFREVRTPDAHQPLVDRELFDRVQQILSLRAQKPFGPTATTTSDYLLSGVVTCMACGSRYVGTAAKGRHHRYRYYTCLTRCRFGAAACTAPRLRADQLEAQILSALVGRYRHTALVDQAVALTPDLCRADVVMKRTELATLTRQLSTINGKTDRYLKAFEDDALPAALCRDRLADLANQTAKLTARRREIQRALRAVPEPPDAATLEQLPDLLATALTGAHVGQLKSLVGLLVADIRVHDRHQIEPHFRVPTHAS
jgi:site-specific DNA recombinase